MSDRHRQIADIILVAIAAGERNVVAAGGALAAADDGHGQNTARQAVIADCVPLRENDLGNGERLLAHYGSEFLFVSRVGFHVFDGRRWSEDGDRHHIRRLAHQVVSYIEQESGLMEPSERQQRLLDAADRAAAELDALPPASKRSETDNETADRLQAKVASGKTITAALASRRTARARFARSCGNTGRLTNMIDEAAPYRSHDVADMDADPCAINLRNGTLRFIEAGGEWDCRLTPHDRGDLITKLVRANYDPEATAPAFGRFLERVMPDHETRDFLQRYFGYCLTALVDEEVFCFFYGDGRNGKSTLVDLICWILDDYSATAGFETLAGEDRRKGADATPDLARLPGCRLVRASEPEGQVRFKEGTIKRLTSREPLSVRRLHQDFIEVYPSFKIVLSGNEKPIVTGGDEGIWRRVLLVPFTVEIAKHEVDMALPGKLRAEREGVLNWMVQGALWYLNEGLQVPGEVLAATAEYRSESDMVGSFITDALERTDIDTDKVLIADLGAAFNRWLKANNLNELRQTTFTKRMKKAAKRVGIKDFNSGGKRGYLGIRIRAAFAQEWGSDDGLE